MNTPGHDIDDGALIQVEEYQISDGVTYTGQMRISYGSQGEKIYQKHGKGK